MIKIYKVFIFIALIIIPTLSKGGTKGNFDDNWKFHLGDTINVQTTEFNDNGWRILNLPHDWSIEGQFNEHSPATTGGGALDGGIGWYRKSFLLNEADKNKLIFIDFDGVYRNSEVWINGHYLGMRPYGYSSFQYELTPYLFYGNKANIIAVNVDNSKQPNSRWYSGSGIYRNVWIEKTAKLRVDHWGTYITTPEVNSQNAKISIKTKIRNSENQPKDFELKTDIIDTNGITIASAVSKSQVLSDSMIEVSQEVIVNSPDLWSIENPYLYKAVSHIIENKNNIDECETNFGIREFVFDVNKGFLLNGKHVKINGVCDHHDLGCLGAAINYRALQRQLEILKEMGCNGIRTSHNPPAPELLDLCDKMGFIVMDEAFDMWQKQKNPYDYHLDWDKWHKRDLEDLVIRDRNHPSVFIWSIGNEVTEQWDLKDTMGAHIARELSSIVKQCDETRPVTSACNNAVPENQLIKSGALDLIGFNYSQGQYKDFQKNYPDKRFIATETVSGLTTRGSYDMPSDSIRRWPIAWDKPFTTGNKDFTVSAYDNVSAPWGSTQEETWKIMKKYDFLSGQYIWTGFDYIGEPTPYPWPARSSYFGIIDLAGFPKDVYYMYQSEWTTKPVLHIFPHWNWEKGKMVDVLAYYNNADEVELFLNGKSLGVQSKKNDDLHVTWHVPFELGTIKAVSKMNGKVVLTQEIKTAGTAAKILLSADRMLIKADGKDLSFIKVQVQDKDGNLVPMSDNSIKYTIEGDGFIAGLDNGSETDLESFHSNPHNVFHGLGLVVIQSNGKSGSIKLKAESDGLTETQIIINAK